MIVQLDNGQELTIPFSTDEITFNDFCDFRIAELQYFEAQKQDDETADVLLIEAVGYIIKGDLSEMLVYSQDVDNAVGNGKLISFDDEVTILGLYAHIVYLLNQFDALNLEISTQNFEIVHQNTPLSISAEKALRMMTAETLTAGEMLETLEFQRRFFAKKDKTGPQEVINLDFELGLTEVAILLRPSDEKIPYQKAQFDKWLKDRVEAVKDIPLSTVLQLRFFLLNCLLKFKETQSLPTSLKVVPTFTKLKVVKNQTIK